MAKAQHKDALPRVLTTAQFKRLKVSGGNLVQKANKYGVSDKSQRTYGGRVYASRAEMAKAQELDMLKTAGVVKEWFPQVSWPLRVKGIIIGRYIVDFAVHYTDGCVEHVDVKGAETPLFKWKRRHWEAETGLKLVVVKR